MTREVGDVVKEAFEWTDKASESGGVSVQGFALEREGRSIPGVLWRPVAAAGPRPLVLMGHGGSGHKRNDGMTKMGRLFAGHYGWWAAAIDGPAHGERGTVKSFLDAEYIQMWQRPKVVEDMIDDWRATLDALSALGSIDPARIGYWGVSMGTLFGLPFVASDSRVRVAVLGKAGMSGPSVGRTGIDKHFRVYAPRVTLPVLFMIRLQDERFEPKGQFELFDLLGTSDKRIHAHPGPHSDTGTEVFEAAADFLQRHLAPEARPSVW